MISPSGQPIQNNIIQTHYIQPDGQLRASISRNSYSPQSHIHKGPQTFNTVRVLTPQSPQAVYYSPQQTRRVAYVTQPLSQSQLSKSHLVSIGHHHEPRSERSDTRAAQNPVSPQKSKSSKILKNSKKSKKTQKSIVPAIYKRHKDVIRCETTEVETSSENPIQNLHNVLQGVEGPAAGGTNDIEEDCPIEDPRNPFHQRYLDFKRMYDGKVKGDKYSGPVPKQAISQPPVAAFMVAPPANQQFLLKQPQVISYNPQVLKKGSYPVNHIPAQEEKFLASGNHGIANNHQNRLKEIFFRNPGDEESVRNNAKVSSFTPYIHKQHNLVYSGSPAFQAASKRSQEPLGPNELHYCSDCDVAFEQRGQSRRGNHLNQAIFKAPYKGYEASPIYVQPLYSSAPYYHNPLYVKKGADLPTADPRLAEEFEKQMRRDAGEGEDTGRRRGNGSSRGVSQRSQRSKGSGKGKSVAFKEDSGKKLTRLEK